MVDVVGRAEDLGFVDVVDVERFQNLRFDEVTDSSLRHDRDRHGCDDRLDQIRVAHSRHATLCADVRGDALQRHDGHGAGIFGDARLVGGDDIHDHAAFEHLCEPALDAVRSELPGGGLLAHCVLSRAVGIPHTTP